MFGAILCRRTLSAPRKDGIFGLPSSGKSPASDPTFTISYLTNSCGLSLNDAVSVSNKLRIKSRHNPDAVLDLLSQFGFTNTQISKLVTKWPLVLQCRPDQTLFPKLQFLRSIGVPAAVSAEKLSAYPMILQRSLEKSLIPTYNYLKKLLRSDKKVVNVFARSPRAFVHGCCGAMSRNIAVLRERGAPESSVALLLNNQPSLLMLGGEAFAALVDRAAEMGFDASKVVFVLAVQVFANMSESTLQRKMGVYRRCGWSESEVMGAFLKHPLCMSLSEKKIKGSMEFLVGEAGFEAGDVARCPVLLGYSVEKRMRPRLVVSRMLERKELLKKSTSFIYLLIMSEEKFVKRIHPILVACLRPSTTAAREGGRSQVARAMPKAIWLRVRAHTRSKTRFSLSRFVDAINIFNEKWRRPRPRPMSELRTPWGKPFAPSVSMLMLQMGINKKLLSFWQETSTKCNEVRHVDTLNAQLVWFESITNSLCHIQCARWKGKGGAQV
ncbi:uncharacterized protein LOC125211087 [Salvia hispanica]|uniref:uncharacterized protein LOC125211087 n=1 Tax=Salvia hispanica TaxID=49212 RepID=UPI002009A83C|nr:uncharacterized protein LOC125211087 [Salvia hispanica]